MNCQIQRANERCYNIEHDGQFIGYIDRIYFGMNAPPGWKPEWELLRWFHGRGIVPPAYWMSLTEFRDWMKGQDPCEP